MLNLEPHQIPAVHLCIKIYQQYFGAINTSESGSGKTFQAMATFLCMIMMQVFSNDSLMLIVCPANTVIMWEERTAEFGIKSIVLSYSKLIGKKGKINHGLLVKQLENYYGTEQLRVILRKKILLVFDESQDTKNHKSYTAKACHTLVKELIKINNGSRVLLLSATPTDKEIYVESMLKLTGIITTDELFHYNTGTKRYQLAGYGYDQLYNFCNKLNPVLTAKLYPTVLKAGSLRHSMYEMYTQIVKHHIAFSMASPNIPHKFNPMSKFYNISYDDLQSMRAGLEDLKNAVRYRDDGTINYTSDGIAGVIRSTMVMEFSKINLFVRLVRETLENVNNSKVVLYVWHDRTVDTLLELLKEYKPLRCDGKVNRKKRNEYRKLFQQDNNDYRLIIAKPTSFGRSIDLHDIHSNRPRFTFINPNFNFEPIIQAAARTYRVGTKSDVHVYLTYIKGTDEEKVMSALSKKSEVTRSCIANFVQKDDDFDITVDEGEVVRPTGIPFIDHWISVYEN